MNPTQNILTPGIDVSHYQGVIDWAKVKAAGIQFAFIKATDGATGTDPMFATNVKGCMAVGLPWGAYHFFRPGENAAAQAAHFLSVADFIVTGIACGKVLPPALDLELGPLTFAEAMIWLDQVDEALGNTPMVYISPAFAAANIEPGDPAGAYPLWIAEYGPRATPTIPDPWGGWEFWQHSAAGEIDGIAGTVDLDWFHGTVDDLQVWVK